MNKKRIIVLIAFLVVAAALVIWFSGGSGSQFNFAVVGDMNFGIFRPQDFELVVNAIEQSKPGFVLFLGGMICPTSKDAGSAEELWKEFDGITAKMKIPVYDVPGWSKVPAILKNPDDLTKSYLARYKSPYYSFVFKDNLFICLDSTGKDGIIDGQQLVFLRNALSGASDYNNVFIATHYPVWTFPGSNWSETIQPLINGKVKCVFSVVNKFEGFKVEKDQSQTIEDVSYIQLRGADPYATSEAPNPNLDMVIGKVKNKTVNAVIKDIMQFAPKGRPVIESPTPLGTYTQNAPEKQNIYDFPRMIEALKIKPGMTVLDLGAGAGLFTFIFADAMKGTGEVYATDCYFPLHKYLKEKASKMDYKNVFPVLVAEYGVDPFYKEHSFDVMYLCGVYEGLDVPYFRELRESLKKDGRLFIVHYKNSPDFCEYEFDDFSEMMKSFQERKDEVAAVAARLSEEVKGLISAWKPGQAVSADIRKKIIRDFNAILQDRTFYSDMWDIKIPGKSVIPVSNPLVNNLIVELRESMALSHEKAGVSEEDKRRIRRLNRMLIANLFGANDKLNVFKRADFIVYDEKGTIIRNLKEAGYNFVQEHGLLPQHYFLEFKRGY